MTKRLQEFGPDIWIVDGPTVAVGGFQYPTRMAVVRLSDGSAWTWSPVKLSDELASEIETAVGPVKHIVAPNKLHHLNLMEWSQRYPDARVYAPPGLKNYGRGKLERGRRLRLRFLPALCLLFGSVLPFLFRITGAGKTSTAETVVLLLFCIALNLVIVRLHSPAKSVVDGVRFTEELDDIPHESVVQDLSQLVFRIDSAWKRWSSFTSRPGPFSFVT